MIRVLKAILFLLTLSFLGSFSYASHCKIIPGGTSPTSDFVSVFQQNMTTQNIWQHINIKCSSHSQIVWYPDRFDPNGWQQKVDRLLNDLEANPRLLSVSVTIYPFGSPNQSIANMVFDFGKPSGSVMLEGNTSLTKLRHGKYEVVIHSRAHISSPKIPSNSLTANDKRRMVTLGGLPITYAIDFKADPTIPICDPKYKYYVDRTNITFDSSSSDFFYKGGALQQDVNFKVEREYDPNCNAEVVAPLIKINGPIGADVETPGITGTHIAALKNGTNLALYQLKDGAAESPMNYGSSHDLNKIGGVNGLQSSRKVRVKWTKTPGKSVKTGRWHATMKYELYFR